MKIIKTVLVLLIGFLSTHTIKAQETHGDPEFWFLLLNHYQIDEQWTVGNELHIRRTEFISENKQFILRPFVNFKPGETVVYSIGYSFIRTEPYGDFPLPDFQLEHNFWEQVTLNQELSQTTISHRYRMEHRFQENLAQELSSGEVTKDGYNFSNRFRYRLTLRKPISDDYFIHIFDELWVSADSKFKNVGYNQNWIYLGLGRNVGNGNIQLAYLHQHSSSGGIVERHPTLQVTFQYDF